MSNRKRSRGVSIRTKLEVIHLEAFHKDLCKFLNPGQCFYMELLANRLERFGDAETTADLRIDKIGNGLWELKAKGNVLGKINVRVFFSPVPGHAQVVVLGAFKKENEGSTPPHRVAKMQNRLEYYMRMIRE
jgi:hypothetical protein